MTDLEFSLDDYQSGLAEGRFTPPDSLCPYYDLDPKSFHEQGNSDTRRDDLANAFKALRLRTGREYFQKTYPLQARTLDYSARSFPAYRFILPEVMSEDWLAIVDWDKSKRRDHVLHQPLSGYIVLKLLDKSSFSIFGNSLLDVCVDNILRWKDTAYIRDFLVGCGMKETNPILDAKSSIAKKVWYAFFREAAYVAAVFHDLGYPWWYVERIQKNLKGLNAPATCKNRSASDVVKEFGHRLLFHALRGYQKPDAASPACWAEKIINITNTALCTTHGFPGALGFLHLNDAVRRFPHIQSPLHLLCVEWAAVAVMMHDMIKIYWGNRRESGKPENSSMRLSFKRDPLSAIVSFADVLQEFQRPIAIFKGERDRRGNSCVAITYKSSCEATSLCWAGDDLIVQFKMNDSCALAVKRKSIMNDERDYFDPRYGFLDMQSLGINRVKLSLG